MATPDFVLELRRHVGHAPLWMPGTTVVILRPAPGQVAIDWERPIAPEDVEVLCVRRSDNGAWTPVTGIVDPGEEPAIAAAREALEEADVRIEVRRPPRRGLPHRLTSRERRGTPLPRRGERENACVSVKPLAGLKS